MATTKDNSKFRKGSGVYTCGNCGKQTRETGDGESSVELCKQCYFEGGQENAHTDNHTGRMADCVECQEAFKAEGYELGTADRWCDRETATPPTLEDYEELQAALRACLALLYEMDAACEPQRIGAIEQAHKALGIPPTVTKAAQITYERKDE